jgi:hypothetical protein
MAPPSRRLQQPGMRHQNVAPDACLAWGGRGAAMAIAPVARAPGGVVWLLCCWSAVAPVRRGPARPPPPRLCVNGRANPFMLPGGGGRDLVRGGCASPIVGANAGEGAVSRSFAQTHYAWHRDAVACGHHLALRAVCTSRRHGGDLAMAAAAWNVCLRAARSSIVAQGDEGHRWRRWSRGPCWQAPRRAVKKRQSKPANREF